MFAVYLFYHFVALGKSLDINVLNFMFLLLIMFLYKTPAKFLKGVKAATPASWGVIIQFPFYAGIFGIMKYSGLVDIFAQWIISFSTPESFPAIAAILSNVIGYFIPSGGSKWAIEAPFLIPAGQALGVPDAKTVIAYMFGCDWVALIQPFFAVPFIAVAGLEFKDFVGYTFIVYIVLGIFMLLGLTFVPF
jgi:short-chain fatty acids transporter